MNDDAVTNASDPAGADGASASSPPPDLTTDPRAFYSAPPLPDLPPTDPATPSALDKLGSCPIPKYKFPLLGFLATVYEHVSAHAKTTGKV